MIKEYCFGCKAIKKGEVMIKEKSRRCLAGSMAMAVFVGAMATSCSVKQTDDPAASTKQTGDTQAFVKQTEEAPASGHSSTEPNTPASFYLAQAQAFEALSVEERAKIDLEDKGYSAISDFTNDTLYALYKATAEKDGENFLYSPTSLYLALSVLAECQDTESAEELYELLGVSGSDELITLVNKMTASLISEGEGDICEIANSIWVEDNYSWYDEAYATWNTLADRLALDVYQMNLQSQDAGVEKNSWIYRHTGGLLGNGEPQPWGDNVRMVIMNTVYFDKSWSVPFKAAFTTDSPFTKADGTEVTCKMMHKELENHEYLETDEYLASTLRYKDGSYMLFMLPQENVLAEELLKADLTEAVNSYREGNVKKADLVKFSVPKLDYSVSVEGIMDQLEALGISKAFSTQAFRNLTDTGLCVNSISQKTCIQVDEKGTKAAAMTEIVTNDSIPMYETIIDIRLDRPYAYAIVSANGTILFSGIVNDPTAE